MRSSTAEQEQTKAITRFFFFFIASDDSELDGKASFCFCSSYFLIFLRKRLRVTVFTYYFFSWQHSEFTAISFLSGKLARYYSAKVLSSIVGIANGDDGSGRHLLGAKSSTNARNSWTFYTLLLSLFFSPYMDMYAERASLRGE
jgi:hypothetical protein